MTPEQMKDIWYQHMPMPDDYHHKEWDERGMDFARAIIAQARAELIAECKPACSVVATNIGTYMAVSNEHAGREGVLTAYIIPNKDNHE